MTRSAPDYEAADFDIEKRAMGPERELASATVVLTPRAILAAVGELFAEDRKRISTLESEIAALREQIAAMDRGGKPKLVVPSSPGSSMIA